MRVAASRSRRAERPTAYVRTTAIDPPTNAATRRTRCPRRPSGRYAIATVAPRPAPPAPPDRSGAARRVRCGRERRPEAGPRRDAEQIRVGEWVAEDALVRGAGEREHRADERREHHARHADLPDDRLLGRRERGRDAGHVQTGSRRLEDRADTEVDRPRENPDRERDEKERDRGARPDRRQPPRAAPG